MSTADIAGHRSRADKARTYVPSELARTGLEDFASAIHQIEHYFEYHPGQAALIAPDGTQRLIPAEIFEVLEQVADAMARGNGVTVAPNGMQLTTQEAAEFLGISRPTLVKLLESGAISFETRGRHRRVQLRDIVDYQEQSRVARQGALVEAARSGQVAGIAANGVPEIERLSN